MKKRTALAALTLTATFALVGCGAAEETKPSPESTTTTTYRSTTTTSKYDGQMSDYLRSMRSRFPGNSDIKLIEIGEQSCTVIEASGSVIDAMLMIAEDPTWTREMAGDAGFTFGTAIPVFCPEYLPELLRITR